MNPYERILYFLYKKNNSTLKVAGKMTGVGNVRDSYLSKGKSAKADARWELADLYYEGVRDGDTTLAGGKTRKPQLTEGQEVAPVSR